MGLPRSAMAGLAMTWFDGVLSVRLNSYENSIPLSRVIFAGRIVLMLKIRHYSSFSRLHHRFSLKLNGRFWAVTAKLVFFGLLGMAFLTLFILVYFAKDLPSPYRLTDHQTQLSTKIFDRNNELLYDVYGNQNRTLVQLTDLPSYVPQATIAIEDKDFYKHQGFDPKGILRAVRQIIFYHNLQGGSTLTQQLIKTVLLSSERTVTRKIKEAILAIQTEKRYTKDEILQMYLNEAPYGGTAWGIQAAAETFFGKNAKDLTLAEAALLTGLPQKPTSYSPFTYPEAAKWRQGEVLRRMTEDGYITSGQATAAKKEELKYATPGASLKAPHFVMFVKEKLAEQFDEKTIEEGGLQVFTSLDYKLQEKAQKIVKEEIDKLKGLKVENGAAVVLSPKTGEILAMVGSKDYFSKEIDGNVNVTTRPRQPGSAFKPITYATALKKGYGLSTMLMDVKTDFPSGDPEHPIYTPENDEGKFRGPVQLRFALGNSYNIPAVKLLGMVGIHEAIRTARDMGITTLNDESRYGLSLTLGGGEVKLLELSSAYGVFANKGRYNEPQAILKVTDSYGKVLYEYRPSLGQKVLSEEVCYLISHTLLDKNARSAAFGSLSYLDVSGKTVSVKTGTTNDKRDNWTIGFTPSFVAGVWVGNNDNSPMDKKLTSGETGAAPIWNKLMKETLKNSKDEWPEKPEKIIATEVDSLTGMLPGEKTEGRRTEYFIRGTEPTISTNPFQRLKINNEDKDVIVFREADPVSTDGQNRWQEGIDNWAAEQTDPKFHIPKETPR
ncbi:MAG: PBP1A family penicillin-binding protein [bacterium]|nr:PBP1A family penicillin-binding protein [bacterium]